MPELKDAAPLTRAKGLAKETIPKSRHGALVVADPGDGHSHWTHAEKHPLPQAFSFFTSSILGKWSGIFQEIGKARVPLAKPAKHVQREL